MPAIAKKYLITSETREFFVVQKKDEIRGYCEECGYEVELVTLDSAVTVSGISAFTLIGLVTANTLHSLETPAGQLLICVESLRTRTSRERI